MTDTTQEWRPNNRPQSTMAREFSAALDDLFKIDGGLEDVNSNVDKKTHAVQSQARELEALEQRLRDTEARLKRASSQSPRPSAGVVRQASQRGTPVKGTFENNAGGSPTSPLAKESQAEAGLQKDSKGEYVMVDRMEMRGRPATKEGAPQ